MTKYNKDLNAQDAGDSSAKKNISVVAQNPTPPQADSKRLTTDFIELVQIDSLSHQERQMADCLTKKLESLGFVNIYEDKTGEIIGGNAGNVVGLLKGTKKDAPGILLTAHMDTVVPGIGKKPIIDGDTIRTDGTTILGADDLAGVCSILEVSRMLKENKTPHGDVYVAFTVAEESGLEGSKHLDIRKMDAKYAFVMDMDFDIINEAGSANSIKGKFLGKAAHAGVNPETGVNSLLMFANTMSEMSKKGLLGRIDPDNTSNLIIKEGGLATNIIPENTLFEGEVRSMDPERLERTTAEIKQIMNEKAKELGGKVELHIQREFTGFKVAENHPIVDVVMRASEKNHYPVNLVNTVGGCDAHEINKKGLPALLMPVTMLNEHTTAETIKVPDLKRATEYLYAVVQEVALEKKKGPTKEQTQSKGPKNIGEKSLEM